MQVNREAVSFHAGDALLVPAITNKIVAIMSVIVQKREPE